MFIIGFLRRDFGAAGLCWMIHGAAPSGRRSRWWWRLVTITLFVPCIAHFFMTVKERGWRTGVAIALFVFAFALGAGGVLNWVFRTLEVTL